MKKLVLSAVLVLILATGALAEEKRNDYQYWYPDKYDSKPQNGSGQTEKQKTYDTQKNVSNTLDYMNKGGSTASPTYNTNINDTNRSNAKVISK